MISVIVPAYNIRDYIGKALDSILAQTYSDIEIIVVDDGSSDGTAEVIDDYAARYPSKICSLHITNSGVTTARLTGIGQASGEWIGFVDGDDEIEPDMYDRLLKNAKKWDADISHCGYQMVFPDGRIHFFHNTGQFIQQNGIEGVKSLLEGSLVEPGLWNKIFSRRLFDCLLCSDVLDRSIKINEDLLMNFYLFRQANKTVFQDFCPYHYIVRNNSATQQKLNQYRIFDPIRVRKIILDAAPLEIKSDAEKAVMNVCLDTCNSILRAGRNEYEQEYQEVRSILLSHRKSFALLGKKRQYQAYMLLHTPEIYNLLYRIYKNCFRRSSYE